MADGEGMLREEREKMRGCVMSNERASGFPMYKPRSDLIAARNDEEMGGNVGLLDSYISDVDIEHQTGSGLVSIRNVGQTVAILYRQITLDRRQTRNINLNCYAYLIL